MEHKKNKSFQSCIEQGDIERMSMCGSTIQYYLNLALKNYLLIYTDLP